VCPSRVLAVFGRRGFVLRAFISAWLADRKARHSIEGFLLGLLLGPIGLIIEALLRAWKPPDPPRLIEDWKSGEKLL